MAKLGATKKQPHHGALIQREYKDFLTRPRLLCVLASKRLDKQTNAPIWTEERRRGFSRRKKTTVAIHNIFGGAYIRLLF